jgi:molecular chaperone DnaK
MKADAEANAEADKREKERIDKINQADSVIFQTEKNLNEFGDKIPADKKANIESALNKLKDAHKTQDINAIDAAINEVNSAFQAASQDMYNAQAQSQGNPNPEAGSSSNSSNKDNDITDVDFEEVK